MLEVGEVEAEPPMPPREPELEPGPAGPGLWICWPLGLAQSLAENVKYQLEHNNNYSNCKKKMLNNYDKIELLVV